MKQNNKRPLNARPITTIFLYDSVNNVKRVRKAREWRNSRKVFMEEIMRIIMVMI
jgi:hypothetical protein